MPACCGCCCCTILSDCSGSWTPDSEEPRIVLQVEPKVVEVPLEFPDFLELVSNPFPVTQR